MFDTLINIVAFATSVIAIYFTTNTENKRLLGCVIGIFASVLNLWLTLNGPPAVFALSAVCLVMYVLPLIRKARSHA